MWGEGSQAANQQLFHHLQRGAEWGLEAGGCRCREDAIRGWHERAPPPWRNIKVPGGSGLPRCPVFSIPLLTHPGQELS